jgi:outer membrane protein assembly factor BamA
VPASTILALALVVSSAVQAAPAQEVVAEVRVHGNLTITDQDVVRMAGIAIGAPVSASTTAEITERLRATKRFQKVDVLKRFASIADPTQIVLVIIVDEGPVKIRLTGDASRPTEVVRTHGPRLLFFPLLSAEDGYGVTYGAQFALPGPAGKGSRLSMPLTWGGDKRAEIELQKDLDDAPVSRVSAGGSISRRTNPFFEQDDDRGSLWTRAERDIARPLRVGATLGWQHVNFLGSSDSFAHVGGDVVFDTRIDPMLARNAVYGRAAWEHLAVANDGINHTELDGRGYIGLFRQTVLVVRALRDDADKPRPAYLQPMLGGIDNLRGFRTGTAIGDTLVATSVELRVPITSPLDVGKMGLMAFVDSGTVYNKGERLADQTFKRGVGGGVWFSAAFLRLNVAVAHGLGASTRVHVGGSLSF